MSDTFVKCSVQYKLFIVLYCIYTNLLWQSFVISIQPAKLYEVY